MPSLAFLSTLLLVTILSAQALAQPDDEPKQTGQVELIILASDGRPAAEAEVEVAQSGLGIPGQPPPPQVAHTNSAGLITFTCPTGVETFHVAAKGLGYGFTGLTEISAGQKVRAFLPPLAPWATLRGQIPPARLTPQTEILVRPRFGPGDDCKTKPDAKGRFDLQLPAGTWWVAATTGRQHTAHIPGEVTVFPGQTLTLPEMQTDPVALPEESASEPKKQHSWKETHPDMVWVSGTIRDAAGHPLPDASVCAVAVYDSGLRMGEMVHATTTDSAGHYSITGTGNLSAFAASLVAYAPGRCPTWTWLPPRSDWEHAPWNEPKPAKDQAPAPTIDLVLTDQGGTLEVETFRDGRPMPDAVVTLHLAGVNLRDIWARGGGNVSERQAVEQAVSPTGTSDAAGLVRFERLIPGLYQVTAAPAGQRSTGFGPPFPQEPSISGAAEGIPVRLGALTRHRLALGPHPANIPVRVLRTDGQPLVLEPTGAPPRNNVPFSYSHVGSAVGWNTWFGLDADGRGSFGPPGCGLCQLVFKYCDGSIKRMAVGELPYYQASGFVAASPRLNTSFAVEFTAAPVVPAKVTVKLLDADGRPLRGTVEIGGLPGQPVMVGSAGPDGAVRFEGLRTEQYKVYGFVPDLAPIIYGEDDAPLPDETILHRGFALLPEPLTPQPNSDTTVILKARPVGYIRGLLRPPPGRSAATYAVYPDGPDSAWSHYQTSTGQFVAGPFAPGRATLRIVEQPGYRPLTHREVTVQAGQITQLELEPPPAPASVAPTNPQVTMMTMGSGIQSLGQGQAALRGSVKMPDGRTPAFGAQVYFFNEGSNRPSGMGLVDPAGAIQAHGTWMPGSGDAASPTASLGSVVLALLPGTCGAVLATPAPGQPLQLTLPEPRQLKGIVTIAGTASGVRAGQIRILAASQGHGRFDPLLSVQADADADGKYLLAGLTPGTYQVQAVLDDLWLSPSTMITVGDKELPGLDLDIGAPGCATVVLLADSAGRPVVGRSITIDRQAGPLSQMCWPAQWTSDGAGRIYIPTLEVGRHTIHLQPGGMSYEFTVLPASASAPTELKLTVPAQAK
jgi:hypothetical protein